jgi:hypothetical protein
MGKTVGPLVLVGLLWISQGADLVWSGRANTYKNSGAGFAISYPTTWTLMEATATTPFKIKNPSSISTIGVTMVKAPDGVQDLMQYIRQEPRQLITDLTGQFSDALVTEKGDAYLGGRPAYFMTVTYTAKRDAQVQKMMTLRVVGVHAGKIYMLSYESPQEYYVNEFHQVKAILASFGFL